MSLLAWCFIGAVIGYLAAQKQGFSDMAGIGVGFLLGPLALLMFFASSKTGKNRKQCPHCREFIHREASVCPKCQRDVLIGPRAATRPTP